MDKDARGQGQKAPRSTWPEGEPVDPPRKVHSKAGSELIAEVEQAGAPGGGVTGSFVGVTGREVKNSTAAAGGRTGPPVNTGKLKPHDFLTSASVSYLLKGGRRAAWSPEVAASPRNNETLVMETLRHSAHVGIIHAQGVTSK